MPEVGDYLLTHVGFSRDEKPIISFQKGDSFIDFEPLGQKIAMRFDTSQRHCTGWRDITTGERFSCPDSHIVDNKYEQCPACQTRTGFNPAFYNASTVSEQQEARNKEPHILYLARFGDDVVKVGISHAKRERSRLLEQGARDALILDTFPSAHIARQYEAKIASMPGIAETLQLRKKLSLLEIPYDHKKGEGDLKQTRSRIEEQLHVSFADSEVHDLDTSFFPNTQPDLTQSFCSIDQQLLTGRCTGMLGSLLFCDYKDTPVFLPLKKFIGYHVEITDTELSLDLPARQISLF